MGKKQMSTIDWITFTLVIVGGLNWGLVGLLNMNLVNLIFGSIPVLEKVVYILVGLSALYAIWTVANKKK